ncbi:MAG: ribonuclease D [Hyphomonadaceae bacterium]|nr:ribonuclease D [Hyphomonadaceae bacterium]
MQVITEGGPLKEFCAALLTRPFVAVDTEFMRESTFWPKLCLIQAAGPDIEAIIDPQAEGLDLAPLWAVMKAASVTKVFHAARQDLEIFYKLGGAMPAPIFDTQIGAMACGLGDSVAYDALVHAFLKRRVDKSHRFTDWSHRPLSKDQLEYALADVTHLRDLYPMMLSRLEAGGRLAWIAEEHAALSDPDIYDTEPENAWSRLKFRRTTPEYLAALRAAAAWRERQAQSRDVPRGRILKDDALYEIAEQRPRTPQAFERLRAVPKGFGNSRMGQELAAALDAALADPKAYAPAVDRTPGPPPGGATVELLKVLLRHAADHHGVAARLIASASDLELIAANDEAPCRALAGWRRDIFGEQALALKHGRISLALERGKVAIRTA